MRSPVGRHGEPAGFPGLQPGRRSVWSGGFAGTAIALIGAGQGLEASSPTEEGFIEVIAAFSAWWSTRLGPHPSGDREVRSRLDDHRRRRNHRAGAAVVAARSRRHARALPRPHRGGVQVPSGVHRARVGRCDRRVPCPGPGRSGRKPSERSGRFIAVYAATWRGSAWPPASCRTFSDGGPAA